MESKIKRIEEEAKRLIEQAPDSETLERLRVQYLGRKSVLNQLFSQLPKLQDDEKARFGRMLNSLKEKITALLEEKSRTFKAKEERLDLSLPATLPQRGTKHLLSLVNEKICGIFQELGFVVIEGAEIEDEWHNFSALNIPLEHPSRDMFDTFYLEITGQLVNREMGKPLLRSHTSPSQIRVMETQKPPLAVISPGRVYRPDKLDASHSFMFHQIEGFCVDRDINFSHLKGVLLHFAKHFFSPDVALRFRPHYFPFTEPSAEVDISCVICKGAGCSVCSYKGWVEILGCGMIHPQVLESCQIDSKKFRGFAFGMGVDRIAMLKYSIDDIRLFYENDLRFLNQFYEV
jgi:phenylalanyl-tRNA synthetase alpha chain